MATGECTELGNTFLYFWRMLATFAVFVLSFLLHQNWKKLKQFESDISPSSSSPGNLVIRKKRDNDYTDFIDLTPNNANRALSQCCKCICICRNYANEATDEKETVLRQRKGVKIINASPKHVHTTTRYLDHAGNEKSTWSDYPEPQEVAIKGQLQSPSAQKIEKSEVVINNSSHLTKINTEAVTDKYRVTKIITTIEVTLQPGGSDQSDKLDQTDQASFLNHHSIGQLEYRKDDNLREQEIVIRELKEESTNSLLKTAKVHSIDEVLEKVGTLEAVAVIIREAGLEFSNLIFGIDYTASNKFQGENSFHGKSLHSIESDVLNPYQQVISVLGKTLAPFANSGFIAGYGFGDARTEDTGVFPLITESGFCTSFSEMLGVYNKITPSVILSGPTNFAPLIEEAIKICNQVQTYHILVIVADGQVNHEAATRDAIVKACEVPLSIIVVGVGDGPWDMMQLFDESLPKRAWDNFHFIDFHKVTAHSHNPDLAFAVQALVEIPDQYKKIKALGLLEKRVLNGEAQKF